MVTDRSRTRTPRKDDKTDKKKEEEKGQKQDQSEEKTQEDVKEHGEKKEKKERVSLSFLNRLSVSKYSRKDQEPSSKETAPKKETPIIRVRFCVWCCVSLPVLHERHVLLNSSGNILCLVLCILACAS